MLQTVVDQPWEHGVRSLARATGLSKSAVQRLVNEWGRLGLVARSADGTIGVGTELVRLAARVVHGLPVRAYARPLLVELAERFNETVYLSLYDPATRTVIPVEVVETTHRVRYIVAVGQPLDPSYGAAGKPVLAYLPAADVRLITARSGLAPLTPATITDEQTLHADLDGIRRRGYAVSYGERTYEVMAFGAAILDSQARVVGCISLSIPKVRFQPGTEAGCGEAVYGAALAVSRALGYTGDLRQGPEQPLRDAEVEGGKGET